MFTPPAKESWTFSYLTGCSLTNWSVVIQIERRALDSHTLVVNMVVKKNPCILAYMLYKLMTVPLISNKPELLCVYLQSATGPQKGRS